MEDNLVGKMENPVGWRTIPGEEENLVEEETNLVGRKRLISWGGEQFYGKEVNVVGKRTIL